MSLRVLRWGAFLLAGIGLLLVWGVAQRAAVPTLKIGNIGNTANWAFVQLHGVVTRYPVYDEESGYLGFWIDDGSGKVSVSAYGNTSAPLIAEAQVPAIGDVVTVQGTLRVKQDSVGLTLNAPEHLTVERPEPIERAIGEIDGEEHAKVLVQGQVREVRTPYEGLTVLHVRDATGGIDVIYDRDLVRLSGQPIQVLPGDSVSVRGAVTRFEGQPQISLDAALGLKRIPQEVALAAHRPIAEIGSTDLDRYVRVQGILTAVHSLSTGRKCVLDDGTGEIALILWPDVLAGVLDRLDLGPGLWLDVQGVLAEYRGELEVIPDLASDVRAFSPASPTVSSAVLLPDATTTALPHGGAVAPVETRTPGPTRMASATPMPAATSPAPRTAAPVTPTSGPPVLSTGALTAVHLGQRITLVGRIVEATQFASGVKSYVDDGSGPTVVWMPLAVYEGLADRLGWRVGSRVRVTGRVDLYEKEIEVVPQSASDVLGVDVAASAPDMAVPIAGLSASRTGEWVTVEARVVAVEPFSDGVKLTIDDGSAQITLLLWQNVYEALPNRAQLAAEAAVRASGKIQEYNGELEIIPGLGADVVLRSP